MLKEQKTDILELNKEAMENLRKGEVSQALSLLKRAEKALISGVHSSSKFWAITLNNLGCYYKRVNKPVVALHYLKKALDIEKQDSGDPLNLAGTYLNICAIRSQLNSHEKALASAASAIKILSTYPERSLNVMTTLVIAHQNVGLEYSFMNQKAEAAKYFYLGWNLAKEHLGPVHSLCKTLRSSYLSACEKPNIPRTGYLKSVRNFSTPSRSPGHFPNIKNRRHKANLSEQRRIVNDNSSFKSSRSSRKHDWKSLDGRRRYFYKQSQSLSNSNGPMAHIGRHRSHNTRTKQGNYIGRQKTNTVGRISKMTTKSRQRHEKKRFRRKITPRRLMVKPINIPNYTHFYLQDSSRTPSQGSAFESANKGVQVVLHENISELKDRAATNLQKMWRGFAARKQQKIHAIDDKIHNAEIKAQQAIGELQKLRLKKNNFTTYKRDKKQTLVPVPRKTKFEEGKSVELMHRI